MSPEYLNNGMVSRALDIFSLGVIIIEMMTGKKEYPYGDETSSHQEFTELVRKICFKTFKADTLFSKRCFRSSQI
jgi:serine/threonine protein kinase